MKDSAAATCLRMLSHTPVIVCVVCVGCLDLSNDSADAGTGGTGSGSGTVLANTCNTSVTDWCGGDVTGTWTVTTICAETNPVDTINQQNAAKYPDCTQTCSSAKVTATGFVTYSSQTMASNLSFRIVESLSFSPVCFSEAMGTTPTDSTCQSLVLDPNGTSTCALTLSNCACQFDETTSDQATTYALSGNEIIEYDTLAFTNQSIQYCVTGTTMTQRRNLRPGINYDIQFVRR
jgi:hypothetical protein